MAIANSTGNDLLALAGRLLFASLFVASGVNKLLWPLATIVYVRTFGLPAPQLWCIGSMLLELACAALLILGYRTRAVAWILAAYCVSTAVIFHHAFADQNQSIPFLTNLAMAGGLLTLSIYGAGLFSIDRLIGNARVEIASNYVRITSDS
ncbi:DoxX family protein [Paraburkholderia acidiphila]|uniref:DoxX family membrane protein n=1 Tax=Paraburkholderia acidiphila TaxID=2571747 RepID=A0A7Z2G990_9BURK|nr:DoxX family protein [Paraburkholderia acidiphila]QGZ57526.1 DoxX family membrane protein [Paraburkholderia acidiphila]